MYKTLHSVVDSQAEKLMSKKNVVGVGIGFKMVNGKPTKELGIICSVTYKTVKEVLKSKDLIPKTLKGFNTDVVETGVIRAQQDPKRRYRPAPGGVSIGHYSITCGTLGCYVMRNGKKYALSNNHVLANSNDASIGDAILQPGPADGGRDPNDRFALLKDFVKINFVGGNGGSCPIGSAVVKCLNFLAKMVGSKTRVSASSSATDNTVDAAIAEVRDDNWIKDEIMQIGKVNGYNSGQLGMEVQKFGRTTNYTKSVISQVNATITVSYGGGKTAIFTDQLVAGAMSAGGDSGSAVLDMDNNLVGLLFAGSDSTTIMNRIENVFSELNVSL